MGATEVVGFDWDEGNRIKCQRHGVSMTQIEDIFRQRHRVAPDILHSSAETRFLAIGGTTRPIFVAFTLRESADGIRIRPISARFMHRKEIEHYEKHAAKTDE